MARLWSEIKSDKEFLAETPETQRLIADQYFNKVIKPDVEANGDDVEAVRNQFFSSALSTETKEPVGDYNSDIPTDENLEANRQRQLEVNSNGPDLWDELSYGITGAGRGLLDAGISSVNVIPEVSDAINNAAIWAGSQLGIGDGKAVRAPRLTHDDVADAYNTVAPEEYSVTGDQLKPQNFAESLLGEALPFFIGTGELKAGQKIGNRLADSALYNTKASTFGTLASNSDKEDSTIASDMALNALGGVGMDYIGGGVRSLLQGRKESLKSLSDTMKGLKEVEETGTVGDYNRYLVDNNLVNTEGVSILPDGSVQVIDGMGASFDRTTGKLIPDTKVIKEKVDFIREANKEGAMMGVQTVKDLLNRPEELQRLGIHQTKPEVLMNLSKKIDDITGLPVTETFGLRSPNIGTKRKAATDAMVERVSDRVKGVRDSFTTGTNTQRDANVISEDGFINSVRSNTTPDGTAIPETELKQMIKPYSDIGKIIDNIKDGNYRNASNLAKANRDIKEQDLLNLGWNKEAIEEFFEINRSVQFLRQLAEKAKSTADKESSRALLNIIGRGASFSLMSMLTGVVPAVGAVGAKMASNKLATRAVTNRLDNVGKALEGSYNPTLIDEKYLRANPVYRGIASYLDKEE